jgi:hypothetical protein
MSKRSMHPSSANLTGIAQVLAGALAPTLAGGAPAGPGRV